MSKNSLFLIVCLSVTFLMMEFYGLVNHHYNGLSESQSRVEQLESEVKSARVERDLLYFQLEDFRQEVARYFPEKKWDTDQQNQFLAQNFSAKLRAPASAQELDFSPAWLEKGKKQFRDKNYTVAIATFQKLIERFPASTGSLEAQFLIVESYYMLQQYQACLTEAEKLIDLYPENEMTGWAMLRMGQIYQERHRGEEASEIFRTVIRSFQNVNLIKQAKLLLSQTEV